MKDMATTISTLLNSMEPERCVLLARMAVCAKEDAEGDPLGDEVAI